MKKKKETKEQTPACPSVGGSALIEGVMMRAGENIAVTCRRENGELCTVKQKSVPLGTRVKFFGLPFIRGIVNFIESMVLSMKTLNQSAEIFGGEEEEGKTEKWMKKHLGIGLMDIVTFIATILGVLLAVGLFLYLPKFLTGLIARLFPALPLWGEGIIEGGMKVILFVAYIWLVSLMPDIRRTFMYHGAEHKSIACFEAEEELTPENAKKYSRFHPRCGTSFMFVMILLGIVIGIALRYLLPASVREINWLYTCIRLLLLPIVVAVGYEFIRLAGAHRNWFTRLLSAPGMAMQRITTREPDEGMLEVAIISLKAALPTVFPDFDTSEYEANAAKLPGVAQEDTKEEQKDETKEESHDTSAD